MSGAIVSNIQITVGLHNKKFQGGHATKKQVPNKHTFIWLLDQMIKFS